MFKVKKAVFFAVALSVFFASSAFAVEYKLSNQFPMSHHLSTGISVFVEKVKEYSGGKIDIKHFDSAQLFKDTEIVEALQDGLVELGLVATNKWGGMIPAVDIFDVPFVLLDLTSPQKFLDAGASEILGKEFEKFGVKNVFWADYGFVQMWNSKRPLRRPADFVGLTMRSYSAGDSETLKALGAAPTLMSSSEMYMALQRGTVDGATTGIPAGISRKIFEVQKYITIANYSTAEFCVQANLAWWDKLDEDSKNAITKAGKDAEVHIRAAIGGAEKDAEQKVRAAGLDVYELTPEDRAALVDATKSVKIEYLKRSGEVGKKLVELSDKLFK